MPLQQLPNDCKKLIADFVAFKQDFSNVQLTCKSLHHIGEKTKRGLLVRQVIDLRPSNLEIFCLKAASLLPNLKSISPTVSLGIVAGVVFNNLGSFVLSSLGLNQKLSITITCFLLILKSTHTQIIEKEMTISEKIALANLVLVTAFIMYKEKPSSPYLDSLTSGIDVAGLNLVSAGVTAAANRFQLFYNNKIETISRLRQQIKDLDETKPADRVCF